MGDISVIARRVSDKCIQYGWSGNGGYFYDADQAWYYVVPGPFRLKIPLAMVAENLDDQSFEFPFLKKVDREIFSGRHTEYLTHSGLNIEELQKIYAELAQEDDPLYQLWNRYRSVFQCLHLALPQRIFCVHLERSLPFWFSA